MQFVFFVAWIIIGIAQISAGVEGVHLYFGVGTFVSVLLFLATYIVPLVGAFLTAAAVFYGARYGWHWEWWQAFALAAPGIVLWLFAMLTGGVASVFSRRV
jgi:hypothetical protein